MTEDRPSRVVIAGGGVAAVEALLALRALAGAGPRITLLAPEPALAQRPGSVAAPFGVGAPGGLALDDLARHVRFERRRVALAAVEPDRRVAEDAYGGRFEYDALLVAVGARPVPALPGAITFTGPREVAALTAAIDAAATDGARLAFVVPLASGWSLPAYELAIMAAVELRDRGVERPAVSLVTAEPAPLWAFGPEAGAAMERLLAERGIALHAGATARAAVPGALELAGRPPVPADAVIALPRHKGPVIAGLPADAAGFIPVDAWGRVLGADGIFAAGDATTFPIRQGGLATQQADTAAEMIAAGLGANVTPTPFRPVLRGMLLTGGAPLYLRAQLSGTGAPEAGVARPAPRRPVAEVSGRALWWPPGKVAGRYLTPLLATARPHLLAPAMLADRSRQGAPEASDALDLAVLMAEADAAAGDLGQAVQALDAAAALHGGELPPDLAARRAAWATRARA